MKKRSRVRVSPICGRAVWLLIIPILAPAVPARADQLDQIHRAGVLRIATVADDPPFATWNPAFRRYRGLDIDFARALARALGVAPRFETIAQRDRVSVLIEHHADVVLANFTVTDARRSEIDFSAPYFVTEQRFLGRKPALASIEQVSRLAVGVEEGSSNEVALEQIVPRPKVTRYGDMAEAIVDLRAGKIDAVSEDAPELARRLSGMPDKALYAISSIAMKRENIAVGLPKGEPRLKQNIDRSLRAMQATGTAKSIWTRWVGAEIASELTHELRN